MGKPERQASRVILLTWGEQHLNHILLQTMNRMLERLLKMKIWSRPPGETKRQSSLNQYRKNKISSKLLRIFIRTIYLHSTILIINYIDNYSNSTVPHFLLFFTLTVKELLKLLKISTNHDSQCHLVDRCVTRNITTNRFKIIEHTVLNLQSCLFKWMVSCINYRKECVVTHSAPDDAKETIVAYWRTRNV